MLLVGPVDRNQRTDRTGARNVHTVSSDADTTTGGNVRSYSRGQDRSRRVPARKRAGDHRASGGRPNGLPGSSARLPGGRRTDRSSMRRSRRSSARGRAGEEASDRPRSVRTERGSYRRHAAGSVDPALDTHGGESTPVPRSARGTRFPGISPESGDRPVGDETRSRTFSGVVLASSVFAVWHALQRPIGQ